MAKKQQLWSAEELEDLANRVMDKPEVAEIVYFVGENKKALPFVEMLLEFFPPVDITLILRAAKKSKLFESPATGRKGKAKR